MKMKNDKVEKYVRKFGQGVIYIVRSFSFEDFVESSSLVLVKIDTSMKR